MPFVQTIRRNAINFAQRPSTLCNGRERTWKQTHDRIARLAAGLQKAGVQRGDRIAMIALNSDRYFEYYYAAPWAGGVMVPLNIRWSLAENKYSVNDSGATVLLVDDAFLEIGQGLLAECESLKIAIYTGDGETPEGMLNFEQLIADNEPMPYVPLDDNEMIGIFYTGGTTGFPKGVMVSSLNLWSSSVSVVADIHLTEHDTFMVVSPMFHMAAGAFCWAATIAGTSMPILPMFTPDAVVAGVETYRPRFTLLVPTMITMLLGSGVLDNADMSSLETILYGASPMSEGAIKALQAAIPGIQLMQGYGQTELSPIISILEAERHVFEGPLAGKTRSAGRVTYCIDVEIRDEQGQVLPPGEVGEVCARGPNAMLGYWNKPEQTASTLVDDWILTGDAGYLDDDGYLFLVDRKKDMIISGGENIFSAEVENALSQHPAILEAVAIGIPSEQWGEAVHAIVRLNDGQTNTEQEIIESCRQYIAGYKLPRSVEFRDEPFPITGAGKIRKNVLREPFWEGIDKRVN